MILDSLHLVVLGDSQERQWAYQNQCFQVPEQVGGPLVSTAVQQGWDQGDMVWGRLVVPMEDSQIAEGGNLQGQEGSHHQDTTSCFTELEREQTD